MGRIEKYNLAGDDMGYVRDRDSQRAADLQGEVYRAINALKMAGLPQRQALSLVSRFSTIESMNGIAEESILELIQGFETYEESRNVKKPLREKPLLIETNTAIDNLNRIINS